MDFTETQNSLPMDPFSKSEISRAWRTLSTRRDIVSTKSLVRAYNVTTLPHERKLLHEWIKYTMDAFSEMSKDDLESYVHLADVEIQSRQDSELLKTLFSALLNREQNGGHSRNVCVALERILRKFDLPVIQEMSNAIFQWTNALVDELSASPLSRDTNETDSIQMLLIHSAWEALSKTSSESLSSELSKIKDKLNDVQNRTAYFPIQLQGKMLHRSLELLEKRTSSDFLLDANRSIFQRALLSDFDVMDVDSFVENTETEWIHPIKALYVAVHVTLKQKDFEALVERLKSIEKQTPLQHRKIFQFCKIGYLCSIALNGTAQQFSNDAVKHLRELASDRNVCNDDELQEALIDALWILHNENKSNRKITNALMTLLRPRERKRKQRNDAKQIEALFDDHQKLRNAPNDDGDPLFLKIKEKTGLKLSWKDERTKINKLKAFYQSSAFTQFPAVLDSEGTIRVQDMDPHLTVYPKVQTEFLDEEKRNHAIEDIERQSQEGYNAFPEKLFEAHPMIPEYPLEEVRRVLLVGTPGSGKTTAVCQMAYRWTLGKMEREFRVVYLLQMKDTEDTFYDDSAFQKERNMETVITNTCFPSETSSEMYKQLKTQVFDDLWKTSTLLVLDGLDESDDFGKDLLKQALKLPCRLLITSDPYQLPNDIRCQMDSETECLGLDDNAVRNHVTSQLSKEVGSRFQWRIRHEAHVWDPSHHPMLCQFFAHIWKRELPPVVLPGEGYGFEKLYDQTMAFLWEQYAQRKDNATLCSKDEVFEALEAIAFDLQSNGKLVMDSRRAFKHVQSLSVLEVLKDPQFNLLRCKRNSFCFLHCGFQEYFCGRYLARCLFNGKGELKDKAKNFVSQNRYVDLQRRVLVFMTQKACQIQSIERAFEILSLVDSPPRDVFGIQHVLLQLTIFEAFLSVSSSSGSCLQTDPRAVQLIESGANLLRLEIRDEYGINVFHSTFESFFNTLQFFPALIQPVFEDVISKCKREAYLTSEPKLCNISLECIKGFLKTLRADADAVNSSNALRRTEVSIGEYSTKHPTIRDDVWALLKDAFDSDDREIQFESMELVLKVLKEPSPQLTKIIERIEKSCLDDDPTVRRFAFDLLPQLSKTCFEGSEAAWEIIKKSESDGYKHVPADFMVRTHQVKTNSVEREKNAWDLLGFWATDSDAGFRKRLPYQLSYQAAAAPNTRFRGLELLSKLCRDGDVDVCTSSFGQIPSFAELCPERKDEIWRLFELGFEHRSREVRSISFRQIVKMMKLFPDLLEQGWEQLTKACNGNNVDVRSEAYAHLIEFVKTFPEKGEEAWIPLMKGCRHYYWRVRREAFRKLMDLSNLYPGKEDIVWRALEAEWDGQDGNIRKEALSHLTEMVRTEKIDDDAAWRMFQRASNDSDSRVRHEVISQISKFADLCPGNEVTSWKILEKAMDDPAPNIRKEAFRQISKLAKIHPNSGKVTWNLLTKGYRDPDGDLRWECICQIARVTAACRGNEKFAWELVMEGCSDFSDIDVRASSMRAIAEVAKLGGHSDIEAWEHFSKCFTDEEEAIRKEVQKKTAFVVRLCPGIVDEAWQALSDLFDKSEPQIRKKIIPQVTELARALPGKEEKAWAILEKGLKDDSLTVQQKSYEHTIELALLFKEIAVQAVHFAIAENERPETRRRMNAVKFVGASAKLAPVETSLKVLMEALNDEEIDIQTEAVTQLKGFTLEQLINYYWFSQDQNVVHRMMTKRMEGALVCKDSGNPSPSVVLFEANNIVEWDNPKEEVNELLSLIQYFLQQTSS